VAISRVPGGTLTLPIGSGDCIFVFACNRRCTILNSYDGKDNINKFRCFHAIAVAIGIAAVTAAPHQWYQLRSDKGPSVIRFQKAC